MQQTTLILRFEFLTQIAHIDLNNVAAGGGLLTPDRLQQIITGENVARSLKKHQQKGMFPLRQRNPSACAMNLTRGGIQAQILELQQGGVQSGALLKRTVQPQAQQQITRRLGRDPEIISTETQALGPCLQYQQAE